MYVLMFFWLYDLLIDQLGCNHASIALNKWQNDLFLNKKDKAQKDAVGFTCVRGST